MDQIYKKIGDDLEVSVSTEKSVIQHFYAGKTIFLTGSTGFLGKALVEKLFRSCSDFKRIYVLIRPKRGLSIDERMKRYFSDTLFDPIRKMRPDFESKVKAIEGDLGKEDLGLSETDKKTIIEETNIVFHNASNVKFTQKISEAGRINVHGTLMTGNLAMQCKNIEGFVYVSTAYSHCYKTDIKEEVYPPPADLDKMNSLIAASESTPEGISESDMKSILGEYPNTYMYTKATAEGLVAKMAKTAPFPCIIYRPAIVISAWKEPYRGWVENLNGPAYLLLGYGLGLLHAAYGMNVLRDFIPVDMTINALLVTTWDGVKNRPRTPDPLVYNYGSSTVKPITLERLRRLCHRTFDEKSSATYSIHTIWDLFVIDGGCIYSFMILHLLFHVLPAAMYDVYLLLTGKKAMALSAIKKLTMSFSVLRFALNTTWRIHIPETLKAADRLNSVDRELFNCDVRKFDWEDYSLTYWNGLRVYLLKDPMSTAPAGYKRYQRLHILHNTIVSAFVLLLVYFIATCLGFL